MMDVSASVYLLVRRPRRYHTVREVGYAEHARDFPGHSDALAGRSSGAERALLRQQTRAGIFTGGA
jgi:hypothetical protein